MRRGWVTTWRERTNSANTAISSPRRNWVRCSRAVSRVRASRCWRELGGGDILEAGAGSGALAADLLLELEALGQSAGALSYSRTQRRTARPPDTKPSNAGRRIFSSRVHWLDDLPGDFRGMVLANEVLDAMPVTRFKVTAKRRQRVIRCLGKPGLCVAGAAGQRNPARAHRAAWIGAGLHIGNQSARRGLGAPRGRQPQTGRDAAHRLRLPARGVLSPATRAGHAHVPLPASGP